MVNYFFDRLLLGLFPGRCICCQQASQCKQDICDECKHSLSIINNYCFNCGLPTPQNTQSCGHCQKHPLPQHRTLSLLPYQGEAKGFIHQLKYQQNFTTIQVLGQLLADQISQQYQQDSLPKQIIPVPMHWWRLHRRGYNQAQLLGRALSKQLALPIIHGVKKTRSTQPQQQLNRAQRKRNVKGAFAIKPNLAISHVALVDDVVTTGETVAEITRCLQQHYPSLRVDVWSLARTPIN